MTRQMIVGALCRRIQRRLTGTTYRAYDPVAEAFNTWTKILGTVLAVLVVIMFALLVLFVVAMNVAKAY